MRAPFSVLGPSRLFDIQHPVRLHISQLLCAGARPMDLDPPHGCLSRQTETDQRFAGGCVPHAGGGVALEYPAIRQSNLHFRSQSLAIAAGSMQPDGLVKLIEDEGGSRELAFAAYNAGPGRVTQWIAKHGDPRDGTADLIDWIERIPFDETRDYVQRVSENLGVYRQRFADDPPAPAPISARMARE